MTDAQKCRKYGWKVGTYLKGIEYWGDSTRRTTIIKITAIGEKNILARDIKTTYEASWSLQYRKWRKVKK